MAQRPSRAARRAADPSVQQRAEQHRIDAERADRLAVDAAERKARQDVATDAIRNASRALAWMTYAGKR